MKMTRGQAMVYHANLKMLANGAKGTLPDLHAKAYFTILTMINCLAPMAEAFEKTRIARFNAAAGTSTVVQGGQIQIEEPKKALAYQQEIRELFDGEVNIRMPKERLVEAELKIKENGFSAALIASLAPLIKFSTVVELESGDDTEGVMTNAVRG